MKIVFKCILKLIFISIASSQADVPCHVCEYSGHNYEPTIDVPFNIADVPKRCKLVTYGVYDFDGSNVDDGHMFKSDEDAIKALVKAGIPVYTYVGETVETDLKIWKEILDGEATYDKIIPPFIDKIKELNVTGIILNFVAMYVLPDCDDKISGFITKMKEKVPDLKFGLCIFGLIDHDKLPNKELFDYSVTNPLIDLYFVDMQPYDYICTPDLAANGSPITSPDEKVMTMDKINIAVSQSAMDKAKIIASITIMPITPHTFETYISYSDYCKDPSVAQGGDWCFDKSQKLYDIGTWAKKTKTFVGMSIDWMEHDDIQVLCGCGKFPVTNIIFDGWDETSIKPCAKIG